MSTDRRPAGLVAVIAFAVAGCTIGGQHTESPTGTAAPATSSSTSAPPAAAPADPIATEFAALAPTLPGTVGLAIAPVGRTAVSAYGDWAHGVAWSTMKVPLALSALRHSDGAAPTARSAIEASDNAAAEQLWAGLGTPDEAAATVQAVLREAGDQDTRVQSERVRAGFTAFGQTDWSLAEQATFTAHLPCLPGADAVLPLMRNLTAGNWGLARLDGAASKAGWGPDEQGRYLVRQLALLPTPAGQVAVTIAAVPKAGTFDAGIAILDRIAAWLRPHLAELPAGACGPAG